MTLENFFVKLREREINGRANAESVRALARCTFTSGGSADARCHFSNKAQRSMYVRVCEVGLRVRVTVKGIILQVRLLSIVVC